jgi:hypothetical protein
LLIGSAQECISEDDDDDNGRSEHEADDTIEQPLTGGRVGWQHQRIADEERNDAKHDGTHKEAIEMGFRPR